MIHLHKNDACDHKHCHDGCDAHECGHSHGHEHAEEGCGCKACNAAVSDSGKADRREIIIVALRSVTAVLLLIAGVLIEQFIQGSKVWYGLSVALCVAAYLSAGYEYVIKAVRNVFRGRIFDENFLMTVASIGALCLQEYTEAVLVMLLYGIGELLQDTAVRKSRSSVKGLLNLKVESSRLIAEDGSEITVPTESLREGNVISVRAGERVPVDCRILEGKSYMDTSALTGEEVPVTAREGDEVLSGSVNKGGAVKAEVTRKYEESTVKKILDLVENAQSSKPKAQKFITEFARWYTPCVVIIALIVAFVPPAFYGYTLQSLSEWVRRALILLVISCPCALVISVPLTYFAGIGACSAGGVLVKGGNYLDAVAKADKVCMDKTGTLTQGVFCVNQTVAADGNEQGLLRIAAHCESMSNHPVAKSILAAYGKKPEGKVGDYSEGEGGVSCTIDGIKAMCGNADYLTRQGIQVPALDIPYTVAHCAYDGKYAGYITVSDVIRDDAAECVKELKDQGLQVAMLTGDNERVAHAVAQGLGINEVYSGCLPQDKCRIVEQMREKGSKVIFVGDGLNDAPVLKSASVGVCVGGAGNDASMEASDVVLVNSSPAALVYARSIARKVRRIVYENIVFALVVKAVIMVLSLTGVFTVMWPAVVADVGVCLLAVLNSVRVSLRAGKASKPKD